MARSPTVRRMLQKAGVGRQWQGRRGRIGDELMAICDQLEKQLETQQKDPRRLLEAL